MSKLGQFKVKINGVAITAPELFSSVVHINQVMQLDELGQ